MTDEQRKWLREHLSPRARAGFDHVQRLIDKIRREQNEQDELKQVLQARQEALNILETPVDKMKLTPYHEESNRKSLESVKKMPKISREQFKEQAQRLREYRLKTEGRKNTSENK